MSHADRLTSPEPVILDHRACVSCGLLSYRAVDGDWVSNVVGYRDDGSPIGDDMPDFDPASPFGPVCNMVCQSQAMYDRADEYEKEALRKVHAACMVIAEFGRIAQRVVGERMDICSVISIEGTQDFLDSVADDGSAMPAWCNRPSSAFIVRRARVQLADLAQTVPVDYAPKLLSIRDELKEAV